VSSRDGGDSVGRYASAFDSTPTQSLFAGCNSLSVYPKVLVSPTGLERKEFLRKGSRGIKLAQIASLLGEFNRFHKEWCNKIIVPRTLEIDLVFRATIKPAYQRRISIRLGRTLVHVVVSLRNGIV
jgi:hypothetical protein